MRVYGKELEKRHDEFWKFLAPLGFEIAGMCVFYHSAVDYHLHYDLSSYDNPERVLEEIYKAGIKEGRKRKLQEIKDVLEPDDEY